MIKAKLLAGCGGLPKDAYFRNVTLLLHGDGSNGAQNNTFLDSSSNNFTITRNGNTTQGSFSPYGSLWSNYFDGSGDYITSPDNAAVQFGSGDFTIEMWVNFSSTSGTQVILGSRANTGVFAPYQFYYTAGVLYLYGSTNGSSWNIFNGLTVIPSVTAGQWYHVVIVRSGSNFSTYSNGVRQSNSTISGSLLASSAPVTIGSDAGGATPYNGYISNLRMAKGVAVYDPSQSTITVPTTPLTAISGTSLLTCQSNRFRDASTNNFAVTRNGDVRVTPFSPFAPSAAYSATANGGSAYFDGSGDALTVARNSALLPTTGDFTIEAWVYPLVATTGSGEVIVGFIEQGSTGDWSMFRMTDGTLGFYTAAGGDTFGALIKHNQWNHIAITRSSGTLYKCVNGSATSVAWSSTLNSNTGLNLTVGADSAADEAMFTGYISSIRVINGTALYTGSTYTVPTTPPTAITNTTLLLNGTNAAIFDNAMQNNLETVGNAQVSTVQSKFGGSSMYFDGSGDYLTRPNSDINNLGTGDFTIELWFKSNTGTMNTHACLVASYSSATYGAWAFKAQSGSSGYIEFASYGNSWNDWVTTTNIAADQQWHHCAVTRNGNTLRIFVDGVVVGTWTNLGSVQPFSGGGHPLTVGYMAQDATSYLNGYIDDLRITKGVARYTANFTPPTAAFANQ